MGSVHMIITCLGPSNPDFPEIHDGIHIRANQHNGAQRCHIRLPYSARAGGVYLVRCTGCSTQLCYTLDEADDSRSIQIACAAPGVKG